MHVDSIWAVARARSAPVLRPDSPPGRRHLAYAALFALSVVVGRVTADPGTNVATVWPAAGVAFVWYLVSMDADTAIHGRGTTEVTVAILLITTPLNIVSGMPPVRAAVFGVGNAAAGYYGAWAYRTFRTRQEPTVERLVDVGPLLLAALASGLGTAIWGPLYSVVLEGAPPALMWQALPRNGIGTLIFGTVLLRVLSRPALRAVPPWPRVLALAVIAVSVYWTALVPFAHQPLSFLLTSVTVVAGVILTVDGMVLFALAAGSAILGASFAGLGPFALMGATAEVFIAQAYIGVQTVMGLVLTLGREDLSRSIHAMREARRRAERQSEMVGRVVGAIPEAVIAVEDGKVVLGNAAAGRLFGLGVGSSVAGTALATGETDGDLPLDHALAGRAAAQDLVLDHDGRRRVVSVWAHPLGGGTGHAVSVSRDVTEDRRRLSDLSSFASVVAHDLLNPIGAVEGWLEVVDEENDARSAPSVASATDRARQSARRLREIVTGLHSYSVTRGGELSVQRIDLQALAERLVTGRVAAAQKSPGAIVPEFTVEAPRLVEGDESLVAQVLDNLIGNSVKYSAPGSVPRIEVSATEPCAGFVTVRVDDDGIGIPDADREKVFEEFHRVGAHSTVYAGTGLGLAICRRMVERHGGTIRATTSPQGGTRMEFTLPAACEQASHQEQAAAAEAEVRAAVVQGRGAEAAAVEAHRRLGRRTDAR